ncbi:DUF2569 domain-containing protein [Sphingomonas daechungensis]|uniref:DUF2569 domain-containing protein n=1 Tax=Sphingomonas daechungensis TaxID=1176646 RepID=UPI00378520D1
MSLVSVGQRLGYRLQTKAAVVRAQIEDRLDGIVIAWLVVAGMASAIRIAFSHAGQPFGVETMLPYALLVFAPAASLVFALRWFADGDRQPQPRFRLARIGRWTEVEREVARKHRLYGAGGIMVSLMVGMLVAVPIRALEYFGSMPAISGPVPAWLSVLHTMMTLDVVLMTSLYAVAFVAALRHVPLFPRLLVAIWGLDLAFQLVTAELVARTAGLPPEVANPLQSLLDGNVKKVLISIGLWLPYLLLSRRVNVTYRSRIPA